MTLQITVPSGGSWEERRTPSQLVLASSDSDLDASKPVTGYRIVIARAKEGQADFATVMQKALGGRTLDDTPANVDIIEEPGYVKVGQTYGTSIAVWTKNGNDVLVQRVTYVPAKDGEGYVITEEAPRPRWRTASDLLGDKRSALGIADAAIVRPPPPDPTASKEVPGAGWRLQFKDTFGPSHDGFIQNPVSGTRYTGTAAPSGGKYVYDLNVTALGMTNIRQRTGGVVGDQCRDCYVSVEAQNLARTSAIFGIALRSGSGEYITMVVDDTSNNWRLAYSGNGAFDDIIPWQTNGNLKAGQVNKLAVLANGNDFTVWINDLKVGQGQSRKGPLVGNVGFYTQPNTLGKMTLAFDNLALRQDH